jgi:hypothetical protein
VGIGRGVDRGDRHDEAEPVDAGHEAPAPGPGQLDTGLEVDQAAVGAGVRLGTYVVLVDVRQTIAGQGGNAELDYGPEADVAGLGDQHRGDRDRQVLHPSPRL